MTQRIMERLRFSNADAEAIVSGVANHMVFKDVKEMRVAKLRRFMARPGFADELELHRVDCTSANGMLDNYDFIRARIEEFANEPLIPPPLLTGHDLKALGLTPGPKFKEILETAANLQLDGKLTTREAALEWARENA